MTKFLIKLFIKNDKNLDHPDTRTSYGVLAGAVGILLNFILFLLKIVIGFIFNSISIMADGINNLSDSGSSLISLIGVKLAKKPADKEHPFGHGRIEYISALIVAFLILLVGFTLLKNSFLKILSPEKLDFELLPLIILIISVFVKVWLSIFNRYIGKKINSGILLATATDARNDVIITTGTILSVIAEYFSGFMIDGISGFIISVFVIISGYNIAKDTLMPLIGEAVDFETFEKITKKVQSYEKILGSHDLITHNYGPSRIMATIHVEVANDSDLRSIHEIVDTIERDIYDEFHIELLIHVDPMDFNNEEFLIIKDDIVRIAKKIEPLSDIHDFHIRTKDGKNKIMFDIIVPYTYSKNEKEIFLINLKTSLSKGYKDFEFLILVENSFVLAD
jgi:cation diffusion facilitator family transporter